jgi:hypothetical protein
MLFCQGVFHSFFHSYTSFINSFHSLLHWFIHASIHRFFDSLIHSLFRFISFHFMSCHFIHLFLSFIHFMRSFIHFVSFRLISFHSFIHSQHHSCFAARNGSNAFRIVSSHSVAKPHSRSVTPNRPTFARLHRTNPALLRTCQFLTIFL